LNLLDPALRQGCNAFFFASSSENYASGVDAGHVPVPTPENVPLSVDNIELPRWSYVASKICGEAAVFGASRMGGFMPIVMRFHNVYGLCMRPTHVIPEMLARCRAKIDPFPVTSRMPAVRSCIFCEPRTMAMAVFTTWVAKAKRGSRTSQRLCSM
jgi:nucleoside-diphosphate-sugar epimerase